MTKNQQYILGTQAGSQRTRNQKPSIYAALSLGNFWERLWERRIKTLGFLLVLRSQVKLLTGNLPKKSSPQKWLKALVSKALAIFAMFPLPKTHYQFNSLILLDSYVPKIPIYYIYRWVFVDTPYKYNLGFGFGVSPIVGGRHD